MSETRTRSPAVTIFFKELRELLRDRRAVFFSFVLPLFLYPLVFLGTSAISETRQEELETRELTVGVWGEEVGFAEHIREEDHLILVRQESSEDALRDESVALFVDFKWTGSGAARAQVDYLQAVTTSREARRRISAVLERLEVALLKERFEALSKNVDVASVVDVDVKDVSLAVERSAAGLSKLLPSLLILLLMTGGAFAAIDLVAGEKERGTLETLYVQAVSAKQVAWGKFLVVLVASLASVALNHVGLFVTVALGLAPQGAGGEWMMPAAGDLATVVALLLPFAVLTSALLLAMSSYARSYREAQTYLLPLTLVVLVPVGMAAAPQIELSSVVAVVPIANVALATREAVVGKLAFGPLALVLVSTCGYAAIMLRKAAQLLTREDVVLVIEPAPLATDASVEGRQRRALAFGCVSLLWIYLSSGWLQSGRLDMLVGLALTLWGAVLIPAFLYPLVSKRPFARTLGLRRPRVTSLLVVLPMALASTIVVTWYMQLQEMFLPFPTALGEAMEKMLSFDEVSPLLVFAVIALSPGICEEFLWRGAFQGDYAARGKWWRTVLVVGFFFGVFHFSIYRFMPTFIVGCLLAGVRLRSASLFPCIVFHTAYNGLAYFWLQNQLDADSPGDHWLLQPWCVLLCVGVIAAGFFALRRHPSIEKTSRGQESGA